MSGIKQDRKRAAKVLGKIGTAAVVATLAGVPSEVAQMFGVHGTSGMALAKPKPPPPPPPPPVADPRLEPLNLPGGTHWFAAWDENTAPGSADFFITPFLSDSTTGGVLGQLSASATIVPSKPLGVKVLDPISNATASAIFNAHYPLPNGPKAVSYVFGDFENGNSASQIANVKTLVNQVRGSAWSNLAYVGQFNLTPTNSSAFVRGSLPYTKADYDSSGANMANTELYPGSPTFRNKSTGDWSNANIRTGLFIAPIGRMTEVQNALNTSYNGRNTYTLGLGYHKQIPWVARFNNFGNSSLDSDGNPGNGYQFVSNAADPTKGQLPSRGDFSAQILHYRMRGAYSVNLFHEGNGGQAQVVGYSGAQAEQDVRNGWYAGVPHTTSIFNAPDSKPVTFTLNPTVDGSSGGGSASRSEQTGTIWSGVYSLSLKQMDILASNLDTNGHWIRFGSGDTAYDIFTYKDPNTGYTYGVKNGDNNDNKQKKEPLIGGSRQAFIDAGVHKLLQFDLVTTRVYYTPEDAAAGKTHNGKKLYETRTIWLYNSSYDVFTDNNRNGVGIPEPTSVGILAAAGTMSLVCRRRRTKALV